MRLVGNIDQIKHNRESKNKEIELHLDRVEYITQKKDGRYYQEYDFVDELDTPLIITGDRLALVNTKPSEEGEYAFKVFDEKDGAYEVNENIQLAVTVVHDFDAQITVLSAASFTVTVSNEEFKAIKANRSKARKQKSGNSRKNR